VQSRPVLIASVFAFLAACGDSSADPDPEPQFIFPDMGEAGVNVLAPSVTVAEPGVIYSFRVEGPEDPIFEVVMTLLTPVPVDNVIGPPDGIWIYQHPQFTTWAVTTFDFDTGVQRFVAVPIDQIEPGVSDLRMQFTGTGAARFDYFENGAETPSRSKQLDW
jgi:hypothetical protein